MKIQATYSHANRELNLQVEDKRMTFDILALPYKDIFEVDGDIYDAEIDVYGQLWVGQNGTMQEYELKIKE